MAILISHNSALEFWRSPEGREWRLDPNGKARMFRPYGKTSSLRPLSFDPQSETCPFGASSDLVREALRLPYLGLTKPVKLLVPSPSKRSYCPDYSCRTCTKVIPPKHIIPISQEIRVVSPAICLLQAASKLDVVELATLGYELAGNYRLDHLSPNGFSKANPLIDPKSLMRLSENLGLHGSTRAQTAAKLILASSASPMETALALLLSLPCKYGGYGLPAPKMNVLIKPRSGQEKALSKHYYVGDLVWPREKVILEYDSDQFHSAPQKALQDATRRNSLSYLGYQVITVRARQVMNNAECAALAKQTAKLLDRRIRPRTANWPELQHALREKLLPYRCESGDRGQNQGLCS